MSISSSGAYNITHKRRETFTYGQIGTDLSPELHTATVNHMREITTACPMPIMPELLADDAQEPCGLQAVCNQHWQREYNSCHEHSYEQCALECTQPDEPPPVLELVLEIVQ